MSHKGLSRRLVALAMALVLLAAAGPLNLAQAAMVTTDQVIETQAAADDRARVLQFMARDDVRGQMRDLGVDPDEAARRVASLSDQEIAMIAGRLDQDPAGQNIIVGILIGAGVLFIALIITDLIGWTDIFPFVKSQR